jgi:hypothetical protein
MKLTEQTELEVKLLEQQIRFYLMINGILGGAMFVGLGLLIYKVIKVIIE